MKGWADLARPFFLKVEMKAEDLQHILEGCLKNDPRQQRALYEHFAKAMLGICMRYAGDRMEAEDVMQVGFIKVFKSLHTFNGGTFQGWIKRIFIRESINQYHSRKRNPIDFTEGEDHTYLNASDGFADAVSQLRTAEIMKLLSTLPEGSRIVFNLFAIEGYGHAEIAEMLGISEGTSKSQYSRARRLLKDQLSYSLL
ncbi:MAG TPA: sigma-70 family RNA polymerase sigma factor [Catalimonadaceae bacterium]|nr:sigma-70 family RNA polymerase sigma factor [Catalimonadaceae bacterium]HPI11411.1 sigma-70 family RNA polymerase sigma factor [Catalimonadaceae bacterium]